MGTNVSVPVASLKDVTEGVELEGKEPGLPFCSIRTEDE